MRRSPPDHITSLLEQRQRSALQDGLIVCSDTNVDVRVSRDDSSFTHRTEGALGEPEMDAALPQDVVEIAQMGGGHLLPDGQLQPFVAHLAEAEQDGCILILPSQRGVYFVGAK